MTTTITTITKHGFLSPGHNSWTFWTSEGSQTLTNPGASHRVLEVLCFVLDYVHEQGWEIDRIFADAGTPSLVMLTKKVPVSE